MHIRNDINIEEAIKALQQLCAGVKTHRVAVEFCPCAECQQEPRHIITVNKAGRTLTSISIVNRNFVANLRIVNLSAGVPAGYSEVICVEGLITDGR